MDLRVIQAGCLIHEKGSDDEETLIVGSVFREIVTSSF
jgi:hypothetical protein